MTTSSWSTPSPLTPKPPTRSGGWSPGDFRYRAVLPGKNTIPFWFLRLSGSRKFLDALNASKASATVPDPPQMGRRGLSPRAQASHGAPMRPRRCPSLGGLAADRLPAALLPNLPRACATLARVVESPPRASRTAHVRKASAPRAAETTVPTEVVLATPIRLARGVKVAQVVLVHLVLVRIQAGQFRPPRAHC